MQTFLSTPLFCEIYSCFSYLNFLFSDFSQWYFFNQQFFCAISDYSFYLALCFSFFQILLLSVILLIIITLVRWNIGTNKFWERFYTKFPVQPIVLGFNVFLFFYSLTLLCYSHWVPSFYYSNELLTLIDDLFRQHWGLHEFDFQMFVKAQELLAKYPKEIGRFAAQPVFQLRSHTFELIVFYYMALYLKLVLDLLQNGYPKTSVFTFNQYYNFIFIPHVLCGPVEYYKHSIFHLSEIFYPLLSTILNMSSTLGLLDFFQPYYYFVLPGEFFKIFFKTPFFFIFSFDGISLIFISLTTFIITLCFIVSWFSYQRSYFYVLTGLLLFTQFFIIFVFSTLDLLLFYFAFESVLIPLFFLVGVFGSRERRVKAAYYLMFYTLIGSLPLLLGILFVWLKTGQTNILVFEPLLLGLFDSTELSLLWFLFLPAFAFKIPLYPFHLWLPEAHVEAPTVGSVVLAGLVLKLGGYGFIRFSIGLFYWGGVPYLNLIYLFCLFSMLVSMMCAACQLDLKRIIAYGSISHMGLVTLCIFLGTQAGLESAMIMMLGHGFVSSALFILVGGLYERYHSRNVRYYGGLYRVLPQYGTFFLLFVLLDIGIPGSPSFVAEFIAFIAVVQESFFLSLLLIGPILMGVGVSLIVCSRVLFGLNDQKYFLTYETIYVNFLFWLRSEKNMIKHSRILKPNAKVPFLVEYFFSTYQDFLKNEHFVLFCLAGSSFLLGIYPNCFVRYFLLDLETLLQITFF